LGLWQGRGVRVPAIMFYYICPLSPGAKGLEELIASPVPKGAPSE
jgi:hypothetical protein